MSRPPSRASSITSTYSVDLNALPSSKSEFSLSTLPQPQYNSLRSEDVNGPSDFTQNLDYWMRAPLGNNATTLQARRDGLTQNGLETDTRAGQNEGDHIEDVSDLSMSSISLDEQQGTILSSPQRPDQDAELLEQGLQQKTNGTYHPAAVEDHEDTPLPQFPPSPLPTRHGSADADSYARQESASGAASNGANLAARISDLEGMLGRTRAELEHVRESGKAVLQKAQADHQRRVNEIIADGALETYDLEKRIANMQATIDYLEETIDKEREHLVASHRVEVEQIRHDAEAKAAAARISNDETSQEQIIALKARVSQLQETLKKSQSDAQKALEVARASHQAAFDNEKSQHAQVVADFNASLAQWKATVDSVKHEEEKRRSMEVARVEARGQAQSDRESQELRARLAAQERELKEALAERDRAVQGAVDTRMELTTLKASMETDLIAAHRKVDELENRNGQLEKEKAEAQTRLTTLQNDLWLAQNSVHDLTANIVEARRSWTEAEEEGAALRAELVVVREQLAARTDEPDLQKPSELASELESSKARLSALETELSQAKAQSESRMEEMRTRAEAAVARMGTLLAREKETAKASITARDAALEETKRLRADAARQTKEVSAARQEAAETRGRLEAAERKAQEAEEKAAELKREIETLREDFEHVNREVDQRVIEVMRRREAGWREKMSMAEKAEAQRKELARALLRAWGTEECGPGEPQAYRYKYVKHSR